MLRRLRDIAAVEGAARIDAVRADEGLHRLEVDGLGRDMMDRRYLATIADNYGGGPVGADTLAAALSEQRDAIEEVKQELGSLGRDGMVNYRADAGS